MTALARPAMTALARPAMTALASLLALALAPLLVACAAQPAPLPPTAPPLPPPLGVEAPPRERRVEDSVHVALGVPSDADASDDHLLDKQEYVVSYNHRLNAPNWAAWNLARKHLGTAPRSRGFRSEQGLPRGFYVVTDADYAGSGYDRGHLCPSADRTATPAANAMTFILSNVHPQLHELNAGPWAKLEEHERALARQGKELYIVAGGLFEPQPKRIGKEHEDGKRVAVPRASYKVIVVVGEGQGLASVTAESEVIAVVMPNDVEAKPHPWTDYAVSIRDVETASGYDFDARVPKAVQETLENRRPQRP
jgi:endonuclease G, mitochondrial